MPRYWILCMSEDNYEIARTQGLIGLAERHKIAMRKFVIGDMMTFYISKKKVDSPVNDSAHKRDLHAMPDNPHEAYLVQHGLIRFSGPIIVAEM